MWRNLNVRFQEELACLRAEAHQWVIPKVYSQSIDKLYEHFECIDDECSYEINQAIRQWAASGMTNWPKMSGKARAILQLRFETAEQLLHLLILRQGEVLEAAASERHWNPVATARRILINWWSERGREMGADIWVFQQWSRVQDKPRLVPTLPPVRIHPQEPVAYAAVA